MKMLQRTAAIAAAVVAVGGALVAAALSWGVAGAAGMLGLAVVIGASRALARALYTPGGWGPGGPPAPTGATVGGTRPSGDTGPR